jgi:hypothetical protein
MFENFTHYKLIKNNKFMETNLTEQESLQLITRMIQQSQNNFRKGAGNIIIFWGYLVAFAALLNFALDFVMPGYQAALIWLLMIPGWIVSFFIQRKNARSAIVRTHIDRIVKYLWIAGGVACFVLQFLFWAVYYHFGIIYQYTLEAPIILIITGIALFVTGIAYRFKPSISGGIIFCLGAIVCAFFLPKVQYQLLVTVVCMVFGYIIPGWKLNKKAKENV